MEELLVVNDEVEEVHGNEPGEDAVHLEDMSLQSLQLQFPIPKQTFLQLVEDGKTLSEAHGCDAHDHSLGASDVDGVEGAHGPSLDVASFFFFGPPSSGSLHEDVASVLKVL